MTKYPKTRTMNFVGAVGMTATGAMLFLKKMNEQSAGILAFIVVMYALLILLPTGSAFALSTIASPKLRASMLWANWVFIAIWLLSLGAAIYIHQPLGMPLLGSLLFVFPQWINIRALRSLSKPQVSETMHTSQVGI